MGAGRPSEGPTGRGGVWVAAQAVLLFLLAVVGIAAPGWPSGMRPALAIAGALVALAGVVLMAAGIRHLGPSLSPFPRRPKGVSSANAACTRSRDTRCTEAGCWPRSDGRC